LYEQHRALLAMAWASPVMGSEPRSVKAPISA
jgi:hypothetical protein